jgi:hypothetical protein
MNSSFLNDHEQFEAASSYWKSEVAHACQESGRSIVIKPWLDCSFRNVVNDSCTDVYSVITEVSRRGLRITQWADLAKGDLFEAWLDKFGDPTHPEEMVDYLQLHCKESATNATFVRELIRAWLFDELSKDAISRIIEQA